jgi:hypothetical protein
VERLEEEREGSEHLKVGGGGGDVARDGPAEGLGGEAVAELDEELLKASAVGIGEGAAAGDVGAAVTPCAGEGGAGEVFDQGGVGCCGREREGVLGGGGDLEWIKQRAEEDGPGGEVTGRALVYSLRSICVEDIANEDHMLAMCAL